MHELNSLTIKDSAEIIATFNVIFNDNFKCEKCIARARQELRDLRKGCSVEISSKVLNYKDRIGFYKCPANFYSEQIALMIESFRTFKLGVLPYKGGLLEQPAKIIEVYHFIENLMIEHEIEMQKKNQMRAKRKNGR